MNGNDSEKTRKHCDLTPSAKLSQDVETNAEMQLGKYRLLEESGQGEFGCVYRAIDDQFEETGKYYAVKILKSRRNLKRFQQECRILQGLSHKSLPKFIEAGNSDIKDGFDGAAYLVMEFVQGNTLKDLLSQKRQTSVETALSWCYELAEGVRYLHASGVVHCDLKPSNAMITWSPKQGRQLRILDLGIAMLRDKKSQDIAGSARYMSPEQMEGRQGKPGDVYSLGLILYELLNGTYPYDITGASSQDWWKIHHDALPRPISNKAISPKVAEVVIKCLEKKPERRPGVERVADVLRQEIAGVGIPSYIGIYGPRGSGKTCYLTSLYHEAEVCAETRRVLEKLYLDLFEKGRVPPPTILAARRLNFQINTPSKYYDIVTKDYGGELLEGRMDDPLQSEDSGLLQEKRDEVYEFFQNARAILIIVETTTEELELRKINDHKKEIESLTNKIARVQQGVKKSNVPLALVLTKWDRMGEISWNPECEKVRVLDYIKQRDWLARLHEKLEILYPELEVFPVFSFIGDNPKKDDVKAFNLCMPLIWAAEKAERNLVQKCEEFEKDHRDDPKDYRYVIENYWRLLYVEKLSDTKAVENVRNRLNELGRKYLNAIDKKTTDSRHKKDYHILATRYREIAETKGVNKEIKESAAKLAENYLHKAKRQARKKWLAIAAIIAALLCALLPAMLYLPAMQRQKDMERDYRALIADFHSLETLHAEMTLSEMHREVLPQTRETLENLARLQKRLANYRREKPDSPFCSKVEKMWEKLGRLSAIWKQRAQKMGEANDLYVRLDGLKAEPFSRLLSQIKTVHDWQIARAHSVENLQKLRKMERDWQKIIDGQERGSLLLGTATRRHAQQIKQAQNSWSTQMQELDQRRLQISLNLLNAQMRQLEELGKWAKVRWDDDFRGQAPAKNEIEKRMAMLKDCLVELREIKRVFERECGRKADNSQKFGESILDIYRKLLTQTDIQRQASEILTSLGKTGIANISGLFPTKDDPEALLRIKFRKIKEQLDRLVKQRQRLAEFLDQHPDYRHKTRIAKAQKDCTMLIARLETERKKCSPFLLVHDLDKIAQRGRVKCNDYDSPRDIEKKIEQVRKVRNELRRVAEGSVDLERKRQELDRELADIEIQLSALDEKMSALEQKCKELQNGWRKQIIQAKSYQSVWRKAEELAGKISRGKSRNMYLSKKYKNDLTEISEQIKEVRKKDRGGYKKIEDAVRACRYRQAGEKIWQYRNSKDHFHIMDGEIERYRNDFSGVVTFTVYLTSEGFKEKKPDFRLYVTYNEVKTIFTQDDTSGRTEMGKRDESFNYNTTVGQQWVHIWVEEVDPFRNDKYGNVSIEISKIFDNETVAKEFKCKEDGSVTLEIEPTFTPNISLPKFKD